VKRHGHNEIERTRAEKFFAALGHKPTKRFAKRDLAAIFVFLHDLPQWMF
jgi:hypothetical protein